MPDTRTQPKRNHPCKGMSKADYAAQVGVSKAHCLHTPKQLIQTHSPRWYRFRIERAAAGTGFIFTNKPRTRLKLVVWDGNGVWLCMRRLHKGSFVWPKLGDTIFELTPQEWKCLIQGVDWQIES